MEKNENELINDFLYLLYTQLLIIYNKVIRELLVVIKILINKRWVEN